MSLRHWAKMWAAVAVSACILATPGAEFLRAADLDLEPLQLPGLIHTPIGVTRQGRPIPAVITAEDLDLHGKKVRMLLVAGLDGSPRTTNACIQVMRRFYSDEEFKPLREVLALSAVVCGNPDGLQADLRDSNGSGGDPSRGYPPEGEAYTSLKAPESQYIWRWIGMHAPDGVIELVEGPQSELVPDNELPADSLAKQLGTVAVCGVGSVESMRWRVAPNDDRPFQRISADALAGFRDPMFKLEDSHSAANNELRRRVDRSPLEVCEQLARVYGHELPTVAYIPAIACIGRIRLGELTGDTAPLTDIERIVAPYRDGEKPTLTEKGGGSEFAGHLIWGVLADATKNKDYARLTLAAADRGFDAQGNLLEVMPAHLEMSDSVFMGCPILAQAGRLTGDDKYFQMCLRQMRFMNRLNLRRDGLHRHSPLDETAWGRGNGFPALGLALSLTDLPAEHAERDEMLTAFRAHLAALGPHQDPTGMWHQVIDHPESYRELTATCMITFAMLRGVRQGWLARDTHEPAIRRGWYAIKTRIASDGSLVDVCTGTGKMKSLREYYDRPAILGKDPRGGAMALLVATEMAAWEKGN